MEENTIDRCTSFRDPENEQESTDCVEKANDLTQISRDVDQFIHASSAIDYKAPGITEFPDFVREFTNKVEARIHRYNSGDLENNFGKNEEEDAVFMEAVKRMARLTKALKEFQNVNLLLNQTSAVLQGALVFLGEEFRTLLVDSGTNSGVLENRKNINMRSLDSKSRHERSERSNSSKYREEEYPVYPPDVAAKLGQIASTIISAEHETDCGQVYTTARSNAIRNYMVKQGFEAEINTDDMVKMTWDSLEKVIIRWINVVKACSEVIFPEERKLIDSIFFDSPKICRSLLRNIMSSVVIQLLTFAEASAKAKRSAEKLFRYLEMHEALQNLVKSIAGDNDNSEMVAEVISAADRILEAAGSVFCDLENSIKNDSARTPVPGGAVHPLARYVVNYLERACEYIDILERIFNKQTELTKTAEIPNSSNSQDKSEKESESSHGPTPFSTQVLSALDLLCANLDEKSNLYKDPSLRYVFLMNNGRYILQSVQDLNKTRQLISDTWCRKRSMIVRLYHKNYQRETCNRVLHCLNQDGLMVKGKVNKALLKEKLKTFTSVLEEIHKTQSTWVVTDEQLQSELRISISSVVIPAYRSFVGRVRNNLNKKQVNKYIKYQPEDLEALIEGLFEGNASSSSMKKS